MTKLKVKDICKLPEKKDISGMISIHGAGSADTCIGLGHNEAIDQIAELPIDLDKILQTAIDKGLIGLDEKELLQNAKVVLKVKGE